MGMYYRDGGMVMTTNKKNGYFPDRSRIENCLRASPEPGPFLRCPVSTPLNSHRPLRQKIPESLTFVSLDFSKVKSFPKGQPHRGPHGFRLNTNRNMRSDNLARRKNFDYYYVDQAFQNRLAAYSNSKWLRSLCSQPVPEIFHKYRRKGEMLDEPLQVPRSYSTPGERSIHDGWDLNSRRGTREHSAFSSNPISTNNSNSPQLTIISRSCTTVNITPHTTIESRGESLPQQPSPNPVESLDADEESVFQPSPQPTPRKSPLKREPISDIRLPTGYSPLIDESIYEHFERKEMKLPDINAAKTTTNTFPSKPRKVLMEASRHSVNNEQSVKSHGSPALGKSGYLSRKPVTSLNEIQENMYNFG
ncbi:Hypothetical predicted protein [Mytilus galloprovincialis]|uniref:Uncharacterized protein n=2 Tax=Mytilus galloprovincialis TaxID=29158 RepID=A0A8B6F3T0_MYTGA|nr:Hypothetical predicted protein [Mytilus galloprovincialis]